jgi:hypothetical protein
VTTVKEFWTADGVSHQAAVTILNRALEEATTGEGLEQVARAAAEVGLVSHIDTVLRARMTERIKKLAETPGLARSLPAEVAHLGASFRLTCTD